ncbi:hypothetical protein [Ferrimonas sp. SCSIO 43195]|uniref:hypothetical protein n=1 Tax=Ferrimonas sp. SCSIO 43195 TaxID=2822844 RepID=UPI002074D31B|nr:hypothetical protein [Ferrimonas sp. SCSIO 43195]USD35912.1 hypothetical protein J8Z22_12745 [Ferrimonas sp. SCSIO 43195]
MKPHPDNRRATARTSSGRRQPANGTECLATGLMLALTLMVIGLFFWQQWWPW